MVPSKVHVPTPVKCAILMEIVVRINSINICKIMNVFFSNIELSINFVILNLSACNVDGIAGNGTAQGTCAVQGEYCYDDGTCGTYDYRY